LLIQVFDAGLTGIWWGIFGVTWSAALFTLFYARRLIGRESSQLSPPLAGGDKGEGGPKGH
jgi:hypothetical protein